MDRTPAKYGNRNVPKMIAEVEVLRKAIRAEGTPAVQDAWDAVEEHIDYAYRRDTDQREGGAGMTLAPTTTTR